MEELGSDYANIKPSYERSTTASELPKYTNIDQDLIKSAFVPNSHTIIAQLGENYSDSPTKQTTNSVLYQQKKDLFNSYDYISSEYDREKTLKIQDQIDHMKKMKKIGKGNIFLPSSKTTKQEVPKHIPDPFEALENDMLRTKWIEEAKRIAGPFIVGGNRSVTEKPTRSMFNKLLEELYDQLEEDWPQAKPTVFVERDLILIFFTTASDKENSDPNEDRLSEGGWSEQEDTYRSADMSSIYSFDLRSALLPYMNFFAQSNEIVRKYQLNRVIKRWNLPVGDNKILFTFRPPWVRLNERYLPKSKKETSKKAKKKR